MHQCRCQKKLNPDKCPFPINLLIVDNHNLFRQGLIRILGDDDQLHVVGQAGNGQEALIGVDTTSARHRAYGPQHAGHVRSRGGAGDG